MASEVLKRPAQVVAVSGQTESRCDKKFAKVLHRRRWVGDKDKRGGRGHTGPGSCPSTPVAPFPGAKSVSAIGSHLSSRCNWFPASPRPQKRCHFEIWRAFCVNESSIGRARGLIRISALLVALCRRARLFLPGCSRVWLFSRLLLRRSR